MKLGDYVKRYREDHGMSMRDFAKKSGLSLGYISMLENDRNPKTGESIAPSIDTYRAVSKVVGIAVNDLMEVVEDNVSIRRKSEGTDRITKKAQSVSAEAMKLAKDYDGLDPWGKKSVRDLTDTEMARVKDEKRFLTEAREEPESKVIPLYLYPAAAGYAAPVFGEEFEPLELKKSDPQGATFAIRIQGDSMEPWIKDGSHVFVNNDPLADGDVGIFAVDGETVCKQYHHDRMMEITYLFSLNRKRADADVVIPPDSGRTLVCLGRVMIAKRFPLPNEM